MAAQNIHNGPGTQNNHNATDQNINYGDQINVGRDLSLWGAVSGIGASHTAEQQFARGDCLKGTREGALEMIYEWATAKGKDRPICWLSGAAGVGKSAIAMTVARSCENDKRLVSSFFFFRSDLKRNNPSGLIPTIAHGLLSTTSFMRSPIQQRISDDPRILEAKLEDQFRELIITPTLKRKRRRCVWSLFSKLSITRKAPNIVVIDGLDECSGENTQLRILSAIQSAFQGSPQFPLRFLISSRPESWIREAFAAEPIRQLSQFISLDEAFTPDRDIMQYYRHHFREIVESSKYKDVHFPESWPSEEDLETLVRRSCGQFVYAATVIKFVTLAFTHPILQFRIILDNTPDRRVGTSPYHELDALYHVILDANPDRQSVLLILPPHLDPSPACIELLLGLPKGGVALTLRAIDFLFDQDRSRDFYIDMVAKKFEIAGQWLRNLSASKMGTYNFNQLYASETNRFFTQWTQFCVSIPTPTQELLDDLRNVDLASAFSCQHIANPPPGGWSVVTRLFGGVGGVRWSWPGMFAELNLWVEKYHGNAEVGSAEDFRCKFMEHPKCFHLERLPNVPLKDPSVHWVILFATGCLLPTNLTSRADNSRPRQPPIRLADCHCDTSGGQESDDPKHLDYQEACFQLVEAFASDAEAAVISGPFSLEFYNIFGDFVDSSLLRHCRVETRLTSLCRTYFECGGDPVLASTVWTENRRTKLLTWVETFPSSFAVEAQALQAQVAE
ncbi:hypothetical protein PQX77_019670 [Marasmius sp. AFHP31]|nr:hypothetical protein PQX77_019670 [Marasmius sp. AFHP31]